MELHAFSHVLLHYTMHVHVIVTFIEIPSASTSSDNDSDNNMDVDEVPTCHVYKLLIATLQYRMQCSAARVMMK